MSPAVYTYNFKTGMTMSLYNLVLTYADGTISFCYVDPAGGSVWFTEGGGVQKTGYFSFGQWSVGLVAGNDGNAWISAVKTATFTDKVLIGTGPMLKPARGRRPDGDTCDVVAGALALGALKGLSVIGSAAVSDAFGTVGAGVGFAVGTPLGPLGEFVGSSFGAAIGATYGKITFQAIMNNPELSVLVASWAIDAMCNKVTSPPAAAGPGPVAAPPAYGDRIWADPSASIGAIGDLGNGGTWFTSVQCCQKL